MSEARAQADPELAGLDPTHLLPAVRVGIAPAMSSNVKGPFWGGEVHEGMSQQHSKLIGCDCERVVPEEYVEALKTVENLTAREVVQFLADCPYNCRLEVPETKVVGEVPEKPNAYTDGSLRSPKSWFWQIGGLGIWWLDRKSDAELMEKQEGEYLRADQRTYGAEMWAAFTGLRNSLNVVKLRLHFWQ